MSDEKGFQEERQHRERIQSLKRLIVARDAGGLREFLKALDPIWWELSYEHEREISFYLPQVLRIFWEDEPFDAYEDLIGLDVFDREDVFRLFSGIANQLSTEALLKVVETLGTPSPQNESKQGLWNALTQRPDIELTKSLMNIR